VAIAVSVFSVLLGDWVSLRKLTVEARTFKQQIADQNATIDSFNRRVVELRTEMTGWRDLHARIWSRSARAPAWQGRQGIAVARSRSSGRRTGSRRATSSSASRTT